jgi:uncharacterized membrane protein
VVALDFVIVVLGIFIAFQVTNWNTEREQKVQTEQAMVTIEPDCRTCISDGPLCGTSDP